MAKSKKKKRRDRRIKRRNRRRKNRNTKPVTPEVTTQPAPVPAPIAPPQKVVIVDPPIPGDANYDGNVDEEDLAIFQSEFGLKGNDLSADFDQDGDVDLSDFAILRANYKLIDLTTHAAEQIDSRLQQDPDVEKLLWSTRDHLTPEYIRNPDSWLSDVDVTCHSVWNSWSAGNRRTATLIAPDAYVCSWHFKNPVGYTLRFIENDGTIHTRTIAARVQIGTSDICVGKLDSDLPPSITHAKVPPANLSEYFEGSLRVAAVGLDQEDHASCRDLTSMSYSMRFSTPIDPIRLLYYEAVINGDSGDPGFMLINNEIVLLTTWTYGGAGSGSKIHTQLTEINDALASMGSTHTVDVVDMRKFKKYG